MDEEGVFWWARVDAASRASKKAPQGLFFPAGLFGGSMLFESTLEGET